MLRISVAIMEIFRDYGIGKDEVITIPALHGSVRKLDRGLQDQYTKGFEELEKMGFIEEGRDGFTVKLLGPGYDYLYPSGE